MKLFIALLLFLPILGASQLTVDNTTMTVEQYIQNVLLGGGVTISNVQFNGGSAAVNNEQVGLFTDASSFVGLGGGLIMGSGNVSMASQANTGGGSGMGGTGNMGTDTDLASITINDIYDEAVIEFDFVPDGDTIKFNYVFASEEYDEYVCGTVNDAFGFFLSGVNPGGGLYTAQNIALIPDPANPGQYTTTPVSINTLNIGVAGSFGSLSTCTAIDPNFAAYNIYYTQNPGNNYEYDGKTVVLEAKAAVVCGNTYHIKLAIGDGGDGSYDSGVFLEEGSFGSDGVGVSSFANFAGVQGGNIIGEACGQAGFVFSSSNVNEPDTLRFTIGGNAEMFDDYLSFPDSIILPVGVASDTIWVTILQDYVFEDMDTLEVTLLDVVGCNTATLYIQNINQLNASLTVDSINICPPETGQLVTEIAGGWEPYYVSWNNNGGIGDTVLVSPDITTFYNANVVDACGSVRTLETSEVWVQCPVAIANVFTPNGDGINDLYSAVNLDDYPHSTITIYNRWGKIVYHMDDYQNDWDGTHYKSGNDLEEGVYYIVVSPNSPKYEYTDHKEIDIQRSLSGYVQLMR